MREYTGPTAGGGRGTVQCPDWCVIDHAYWGDEVDDMFHRSEEVSVLPPGAPAPASTGHPYLMPQLAARLVMHSTDPRPCAAVVSVELSWHKEDGVDLDVPGVDELLARLDAYRARLVELRGALAAIHEERRAEW